MSTPASPPAYSIPVGIEDEKRLAAEAAVELVEPGMAVGLGTGTTVAYFLPALAARRLDLRCVATSVQPSRRPPAGSGSSRALRRARPPRPRRRRRRPDRARRLARQGRRRCAHAREDRRRGGGPLRRHRIVGQGRRASRAARPTRADRLRPLGDHSRARRRGAPRRRTTPDGGVIADFLGRIDDPGALAARLDATPGVVAHGLFAPTLVSEIIVARGEQLSRFTPPGT